jgi:hypothetical protein
MKRRPDRLAGMRNSLGRRVIEPESFVSSSCVGNQFQNQKRPANPKIASTGLDTNVQTGGKLYSIRLWQGKSRIPLGLLLCHVDLEFTRDS